jgi:glycosyltransferase involved in cell wall biosynthesis
VEKLKTTLLIPVWDEIIGLKEIMPRIDPSWCDQIIILDGGSTDGTCEWCREHGYFVYEQQKRGLHNAYTEVWPLIEGDVVITFSPDGNCLPESIPELIAKMREGYDMVLASRYLGSAKSDDDTWLTGFGNWFFTGTINVLYRAHYTDAMGIFRAYKKSIIYDLDLHKDESYATEEWLFSTNVSWEPLLSVRAAKRKLRVTEIPADEPDRIGGKAKLQIWRWGAAYYFEFLRETFVWR